MGYRTRSRKGGRRNRTRKGGGIWGNIKGAFETNAPPAVQAKLKEHAATAQGLYAKHSDNLKALAQQHAPAVMAGAAAVHNKVQTVVQNSPGLSQEQKDKLANHVEAAHNAVQGQVAKAATAAPAAAAAAPVGGRRRRRLSRRRLSRRRGSKRRGGRKSRRGTKKGMRRKTARKAYKHKRRH